MIWEALGIVFGSAVIANVVVRGVAAVWNHCPRGCDRKALGERPGCNVTSKNTLVQAQENSPSSSSRGGVNG